MPRARSALHGVFKRLTSLLHGGGPKLLSAAVAELGRQWLASHPHGLASRRVHSRPGFGGRGAVRACTPPGAAQLVGINAVLAPSCITERAQAWRAGTRQSRGNEALRGPSLWWTFESARRDQTLGKAHVCPGRPRLWTLSQEGQALSRLSRRAVAARIRWSRYEESGSTGEHG